MEDGKSVIVVEDSSTVQKIITHSLSEAGFEVVTYPSINDVLEMPPEGCMHVAIVDLILPGIGGITGIPLLREKWPDIGVIAMTSGSELMNADTLLTTARKVGAHRILRKPFAEPELLESVGDLVAHGFGDDERDRRILVVEDSRTMRKFVKRALRHAEYDVLEAGSMEEALEAPDILGVDLIITDIFMPGRGGVELIIEVRKNWPDVPIIAMSGGYGKDGDNLENALSAALKVGANAALNKPFTEPQLINAVEQLIDAA